MDEATLTALLTKWQLLLRMQDWRIRASFSDSIPEDDSGHVVHAAESQTAEIFIVSAEGYEQRTHAVTEYDPEQILVHELLHCKFHFLDTEKSDPCIEFAIDSVAETLVKLRRATRDKNPTVIH